MVSTDVSRPSYSPGSKKTAAEDLQDAQSTLDAQKKMEPRVSGELRSNATLLRRLRHNPEKIALHVA
jgi:hypothetical protein